MSFAHKELRHVTSVNNMARTQQLSCSTGKHATSGDCDITVMINPYYFIFVMLLSVTPTNLNNKQCRLQLAQC